KDLTRQLGELQEGARAWKADAIASQQSNIEDLAERIDQFVHLRTELVRLAKEEGTAAARAFGDTDASRSATTLLVNARHSIARAYEQEIARARGQVSGPTLFPRDLICPRGLWDPGVGQRSAIRQDRAVGPGAGLARLDAGSRRG